LLAQLSGKVIIKSLCAIQFQLNLRVGNNFGQIIFKQHLDDYSVLEPEPGCRLYTGLAIASAIG
jgi:hypothetical protein